MIQMLKVFMQNKILICLKKKVKLLFKLKKKIKRVSKKKQKNKIK